MDSKSFICSIFLTLFAFVVLAATQPTVTVEQGVVVGMSESFQESQFIGVNKTIDVFKGVPFAEPPVGPLRFQPPQAKGSWNGTYNATYFRDACPQTNYVTQYSEDCLYLNIYAPRPAISGGAAVMVWIHGGAFAVGSASEPSYNGIPLVATGDVILVSINYRLGVFGFLSTGDDALPGNLGLLDQVLALQWIKQNIAAFGGDTDRITIFGESAGSASVSWLVLSQLTAGLFNRAVMQSGTAFSPWALKKDADANRNTAFQLGRNLGCDSSDSTALVSCLRTKNMLDVKSAADNLFFLGAPVIDGAFVDDTPDDLYTAGRYSPADILVGSMADEGTFYIALNPLYAEYFYSEDPPFMNRDTCRELISYELTSTFGGSNQQIVDDIMALYSDSQTSDYFRSFVNFYTDYAFACGANRAASVHAQAGDAVFLYQVTQTPSVSVFDDDNGNGPGWLGATHGEDITFVFGTAFSRGLQLTDEEKELSVKFMKYWTNFAKTGNPGLNTNASQPELGSDFWPLFNTTSLDYKILNVNLATGSALKRDVCKTWNNDLFPRLDELDTDNGAAGVYDSVGKFLVLTITLVSSFVFLG